MNKRCLFCHFMHYFLLKLKYLQNNLTNPCLIWLKIIGLSHPIKFIRSLSGIWTKLNINLVMMVWFKLETIFAIPQAASKKLPASKVVKSYSKIIVLVCEFCDILCRSKTWPVMAWHQIHFLSKFVCTAKYCKLVNGLNSERFAFCVTTDL